LKVNKYILGVRLNKVNAIAADGKVDAFKAVIVPVVDTIQAFAEIAAKSL
jgi:hypothetical protein